MESNGQPNKFLPAVIIIAVLVAVIWPSLLQTEPSKDGDAGSSEDEDIQTNIPTNAHAGDRQFDVAIVASSSGEYPHYTDGIDDTHSHTIVSGTLELNPCCPGTHRWNTSHLTFAVASNSQNSLCYTLDRLGEGYFLINSGRINASISDSSLLVIMSLRMHQEDSIVFPTTYFAHFYTYHYPNRWVISIAVVRHGPQSEKADVGMKYRYPGWKKETVVDFQFAGEKIHLGFNQLAGGGHISANGCWKIYADISDTISREEVEHREVVHVNFSVVRIRNECSSPEPYNHEFNMHGTRKPVFYRIYMTHEEIPADNCHKVKTTLQLYNQLAEIGDWESLCENLGVKHAIVVTIRGETIDIVRKRRRCLQAFFNMVPCCWETVVKAIRGDPFYNERLASEIIKTQFNISSSNG